MNLAQLSLAETQAAAELHRAAMDYAALCADHGPEHMWHDEWRAKFITARAAWRDALAELKAATDDFLDPAPEGLTDRCLAAVHAELSGGA